MFWDTSAPALEIESLSPRSLVQTYTIYSISNSPYQEWQADLLDYTFEAVAQPGKLIRLCSEDSRFPGRRGARSSVGETLFTPSYSRLEWPYVRVLRWWVGTRWSLRHVEWAVMNKPGSLRFLFENRGFHDDDRLIFLDPDMVFTRPWAPAVAGGTVHGQKWIGYGRRFCEATSIHPELCPASADGCVMYPYAIRAGDLRPMVADIEHFSLEGYRKAKLAGAQGVWMADMSAFQTAMTKHGLTMKAVDNVGLCSNWPNRDDPDAPILHYCQPMRDRAGALLWGKGHYLPWTRPPDPSRATNRVDREVLEILTRKVTEKGAAPMARTSEPVPESM